MQFEIGDFCSLSSGVKIWCTSDDFVNDLVTIIPPEAGQVKKHLIRGNVTLGHYTAVGSNSVVMPDNYIPEGTVLGALSFAPAKFEFRPWSVYAGIPLRFVCDRNRDAVLEQVKKVTTLLEQRADSEKR